MQALVRGLAIVDLVAQSPKPPTFRVLTDQSGIPKGTLHRVIQTLIEAHYLKVDESTQTYKLGPRPFQLAHRVWDQFDLRGASAPELVRLRDLTNETVRVGILDQDRILYIDQCEPSQALRVSNGVGGRASLHGSALGKAIAAHLDPARRSSIYGPGGLQAFTDKTIVAPGDLDQQLNIIKARGYAVSIEEQHDWVNAVAAPILDHASRPLGAIGIVGPAFRLDEDRLHQLGREVIESARRISGSIGEPAMSIAVASRPAGADEQAVDIAVPGTDFLGEGPHWSEGDGRLWWVDILAPAIHSADPGTRKRQTMRLPELVSAIVPKTSGGHLVATETGIKTLDEGGGLHMISSPERDRPGNRFNDGKCDRMGRFWVGSLAIDTSPGRGQLWRIDEDGSANLMDDGFQVSNGLGWSPDDRRMYFTDSATRCIFAYDFDLASGTISDRRALIDVSPEMGTPDGLCVDADGDIWVALWDGWSIARFGADGEMKERHPLPVPRPTSCCFGGPDLSALYVTTARIRLSSQVIAEAPASGSVLSLSPGVRGQSETKFAG